MVPAWLVTISFLLSIGAGVVLLVRSFREKDRGRLLELKLFGHSLKATRPVMQAVIGCILIASPIIGNAAASPPVMPVKTAAQVSEVSHIPDADYKNVVFVRDLAHLDLRAVEYRPWYFVVPGAQRLGDLILKGKIRTNPATLTNYLWLKKRAQLDKISFKYSTRGTMDARCINLPYTLQRALVPDQHGGRTLSESWNVVVDISQVPIDNEFLIINEVTYWNAFNGPDGDSYGTYAGDQSEPEDLSLMILFPPTRPFTGYTLYGYQEDAPQPATYRGTSTVVPSDGHSAFYWAIRQPRPKHIYEVAWQW